MEGGEWGSFNTVCVNEEADFMAQLFPNTNDVQVNYGHNCSNNGEGGSYYSPDSTSQSQNNLYCFSKESISYRSGHESNYNNFLSDHHHHHHHHASSLPFDFLHCQMDGDNGLTGDDQEESPVDPVAEDKNSDSCENSKKRGRVSDVQKEKRKGIKGKKSQKKGLGGGDIEEEENQEVGVNRQSSSCGSLEDDCSSKGTTTTTNTATALNSNGKTRASRGSATDPQSLYARKRRERINERLKILQSLVPNGTKVDISTMLEEAVQYVKFLQLQIKLLSSDDLWMYAPIAYNGMNIGLDFNINIPR